MEALTDKIVSLLDDAIVLSEKCEKIDLTYFELVNRLKFARTFLVNSSSVDIKKEIQEEVFEVLRSEYRADGTSEYKSLAIFKNLEDAKSLKKEEIEKIKKNSERDMEFYGKPKESRGTMRHIITFGDDFTGVTKVVEILKRKVV